MSRVLRLLCAAAVVLAALVASTSTAGAHAELIRSSPELGGSVTTDVDVVRLQFTPLDDTAPYELDVVDADGASVTTGPVVRVDQGTIEVPVAIEVTGVYTVRYEVTGADLDITPGSFEFTVEPDSGSSGLPLIVLWVVALGAAAIMFLRRPGKRSKT